MALGSVRWQKVGRAGDSKFVVAASRCIVDRGGVNGRADENNRGKNVNQMGLGSYLMLCISAIDLTPL